MTIHVTCGSCGVLIRAPEAAAGKSTTCPKCRTLIRIPAPGFPEPPADAYLAGQAAPPPVEQYDVDLAPAHDYGTESRRSSRGGRRGNEVGFRCPYCNTDAIPEHCSEIMPIGWWIFIISTISCVGLLWGWIALLIFRRQYRQCRSCGMHLGAVLGN